MITAIPLFYFSSLHYRLLNSFTSISISISESPVHIPHFSGHSFLEFPGLNRSVLAYTEVEIVFKPTSTEGLVLYNGFSRDRKGDFLSLAMKDGHLEFRFDLGTGPAEIR